MVHILFLYDKELIPEDGGTERVSDLIIRGLNKRQYLCEGFLIGKQNGTFYFGGRKIDDLYLFLKGNNVDIVVNQLGVDWLLKEFLKNGGKKWRNERGKIITCFQFNPEFASYVKYQIHEKKDKGNYIGVLKDCLLYPYHRYKEKASLSTIFHYLYMNSDVFTLLSDKYIKPFKKEAKIKDTDKIFTINNPLTFDYIKKESDLSQKENIVLVVSRMDEYQKRISYILKAWPRLSNRDRLNDWRLIIVGDGADLNRYKVFAEKHQLKNIEFKGQQNSKCFYEKASIFLMTSTREGWGLTLTESLQNGVIPIVMNSNEVFSDIIKNGVDGFLVPDKSISSMVNKMELLMANGNLRLQMAKSALHNAKQFRIDRTLDRWEILIKRLINL